MINGFLLREKLDSRLERTLMVSMIREGLNIP